MKVLRVLGGLTIKEGIDERSASTGVVGVKKKV